MWGRDVILSLFFLYGSGDGFVGWTGGDSPAAIPVATSGACGRKKRKKNR
jgi:hypothetical protein